MSPPPRSKRSSGSRRRARKTGEYRAKLPPQVDVKQLALQLADLLRPAALTRLSFGQLAEDWLKRVVRVHPGNERRHVAHMGPLLALKEGELTKAAIEHCFVALDKERGGKLSSASLNMVRSTGRLIIEDAAANGRWSGRNPFNDVAPRRVSKKPYPRITVDELSRALACMRPDRQRECIWQIHAGTRPGEQKAMLKADVDLERGFVTICRSNARNETKTGVPREIPIPAGARDALIEAMRVSPSELVFPRPDGTRQRHDVKLSKMLRTAFKRAGVITGFKLACRRKGCGYSDQVLIEQRDRLCPICGFKLWCEPIPKHFTWYGLRHAANNLHRELGADAYAVKAALGHAPRDVNDEFYSHLSDERFKAELSKLVIAPKRRP